jgi:predicted AAA+ superfamily ATPase
MRALWRWRTRVMDLASPHSWTPGRAATGKSTWLGQMFPDALRIDLLAPEALRAYQARPDRLRERLAAAPAADTVVIDDIQKAPQLLDVVHSLLEERAGIRFALTGSSARKLRHGAANLLGGRLVSA